MSEWVAVRKSLFSTFMWTKGKVIFIYLFIFLFRIVAHIIKKHCFTILANINILNFTECIIWFHSDLVLFCNIPWERLLAGYQIHFLFNLWTKLSYFFLTFLFVRCSHTTPFYPMEYEQRYTTSKTSTWDSFFTFLFSWLNVGGQNDLEAICWMMVGQQNGRYMSPVLEKRTSGE